MSALQLWYFSLTEAKRRKKMRHTKSQQTLAQIKQPRKIMWRAVLCLFSSARFSRRAARLLHFGEGAIWQSNIHPQSLARFAHFSILTLAFFSAVHTPRPSSFTRAPSRNCSARILRRYSRIFLISHFSSTSSGRAGVREIAKRARFLYFSPSLVVVEKYFFFANTIAKISLHVCTLLCQYCAKLMLIVRFSCRMFGMPINYFLVLIYLINLHWHGCVAINNVNLCHSRMSRARSHARKPTEMISREFGDGIN